ncbi:MAG: hypothetical protein ACO274_09255, partial [Vulcanococcus sp.]
LEGDEEGSPTPLLFLCSCKLTIKGRSENAAEKPSHQRKSAKENNHQHDPREKLLMPVVRLGIL